MLVLFVVGVVVCCCHVPKAKTRSLPIAASVVIIQPSKRDADTIPTCGGGLVDAMEACDWFLDKLCSMLDLIAKGLGLFSILSSY